MGPLSRVSLGILRGLETLTDGLHWLVIGVLCVVYSSAKKHISACITCCFILSMAIIVSICVEPRAQSVPCILSSSLYSYVSTGRDICDDSSFSRMLLS